MARKGYKVSPFGHMMRDKARRTYGPPGWDADAVTGCWNWTGSYYSTTGRPHWDGKLAYRRVYEERVGPIADGNHIHHACQNIKCVNPAHLESLTPTEHKARHA